MPALKTSTDSTMHKTQRILTAGLLGLATLLPAGMAAAGQGGDRDRTRRYHVKRYPIVSITADNSGCRSNFDSPPAACVGTPPSLGLCW